ncbi:hypothetical protein [Abyssisolibacter fermentans]|uniref:hypothetical protein n=1 Tax=Abyssisolibacter fermentans TaxID=1766203 RepID=UPI00083405DE|nr:hypothetical protein [Abyssisolibacter fermentans]
MIKCSFCGYEFDEQQLKEGCVNCPMSKACNKFKCPNCGFHVMKEPKLIIQLKKWVKKIEFRNKNK